MLDGFELWDLRGRPSKHSKLTLALMEFSQRSLAGSLAASLTSSPGLSSLSVQPYCAAFSSPAGPTSQSTWNLPPSLGSTALGVQVNPRLCRPGDRLVSLSLWALRLSQTSVHFRQGAGRALLMSQLQEKFSVPHGLPLKPARLQTRC